MSYKFRGMHMFGKGAIGKRYVKYGIQMTIISAISNLFYGFATSFSGPMWVIPLWALFSGSMFLVRYGMIKTNRPCEDCPLEKTGLEAG
jgi:hypothetical protein